MHLRNRCKGTSTSMSRNWPSSRHRRRREHRRTNFIFVHLDCICHTLLLTQEKCHHLLAEFQWPTPLRRVRHRPLFTLYLCSQPAFRQWMTFSAAVYPFILSFSSSLQIPSPRGVGYWRDTGSLRVWRRVRRGCWSGRRRRERPW